MNKENGRRARKKALTRRQIVETAIRLFSDRGIDAVTVDQIAAAADIGRRTIYNYFPKGKRLNYVVKGHNNDRPFEVR